MSMLILKDNTKYSSTADNLERFLSLQNIANRNVSELLDDNDNDLLIYLIPFPNAMMGPETCLYCHYTPIGRRKYALKPSLKQGIWQALSESMDCLFPYTPVSPKIQKKISFCTICLAKSSVLTC